MNSPIHPMQVKRLLLPLCLVACMILLDSPVQAQQMPPRPMSVTKWLDLNFGAFCGGTTGNTVTISPYGDRTYTGKIVLLTSFPSPAKFDIDAISSTMIHVLNGPDAIMSGENGGSMQLHIGDSYPSSPFMASGSYTTVCIGGTLTVLTETLPPGYYSCTFDITFIQE